MGKLEARSRWSRAPAAASAAAIAERFAREGAKVVCTARTLEEGEHQTLEGSLRSDRPRDRGRRAARRSRWRATSRTTTQCERAVARGARGVRSDRRARQQRCAHLLHADRRLPREQVAALVRGQRARAVLHEQARARRHAAAQARRDRQHLERRGDRSRPRSVQEAARRGRGGTLYGAEKAALERFTQGLAAEVYERRHLGHAA